MRRAAGLWAMIQQTARPDSAAPMVKAETADATSRLSDTRLSGSISRLCCRRPADGRTHSAGQTALGTADTHTHSDGETALVRQHW